MRNGRPVLASAMTRPSTHPATRGLSQLELLLVLAILGILAGLAVSELRTLSRRNKT